MKEYQYRLERTAFQMLSFKEADKEMQQSNNQPAIANHFGYFNYLMSVAYRFLGEPWPAMDKTSFEMRKHN